MTQLCGVASKKAAINQLVDVSIVIPVHNEGSNILPLMNEINDCLQSLRIAFEVIWIDDASSDNTQQVLKEIEARYRNISSICLPTRSGQSAAIWRGLAAVRGKVIVTMDGDGQNDPKDIARLLEALVDADLVVGWRKVRRDSVLKRSFSISANFFRNIVTGSDIQDSGCSLRAFRCDLIPTLIPFHGLHRFLPTLAEISGRRIKVVATEHRVRKHGVSKYGTVSRGIISIVDCMALGWLKCRRIK